MPDSIDVEKRAFRLWRLDVATTGLPDGAFPEWVDLDQATRHAYRTKAFEDLRRAEADDGA